VADLVREFCGFTPFVWNASPTSICPADERRVGPEDVVQSVRCARLLRRAKIGESNCHAEGLWGLLCAITPPKSCGKTRFHLRQKRGLIASGIPTYDFASPAARLFQEGPTTNRPPAKRPSSPISSPNWISWLYE